MWKNLSDIPPEIANRKTKSGLTVAQEFLAGGKNALKRLKQTESVKPVYRTIEAKEFIPVSRLESELLEDQLQALYFSWVLDEGNRILMPLLDLIYAIPNGSNKSKTQQAIFKATGLRAGVPDVKVDVPRQGYNSLFIEFKSYKRYALKNHGMSDNQIDWKKRLEDNGHLVLCECSPTKAIKLTKDYLGY